jgi:N-acetylglucosamine-6-phosphate deacetylase
MGHTAAAYADAVSAIRKGAASCTHIFNAMTALHHRRPGTVGAAMDSSIYCELIADNIHVDPAVQRVLLKVKGIDKIILVSDSMRACLLNDGEYDLGGQRVIVKGEEARLPEGNLAGSLLTLDRAIRNLMENTGIGIADAVKTVTINPARLLQIEESKGSIKVGSDADFTIFDKNINIFSAYLKGNKIYERYENEGNYM